MIDELLTRFCTPSNNEPGDSEKRLLSDAEAWEHDFRGIRLQGYSWGQGPEVLLLHGWGSRSGHLALMARMLARSGFRVSVYDAPAHGSSVKPDGEPRSSFFEYLEALMQLGANRGPWHAVVGHSLGAAAALCAAAGYRMGPGAGLVSRHLVLISTPAGLWRMAEAFCRGHGVPEHYPALVESLESRFNFSVADYDLSKAASLIECPTLLVHDRDDQDIPLQDAIELSKQIPEARMKITEKLGHQRLLISRDVLGAVKEFIGLL